MTLAHADPKRNSKNAMGNNIEHCYSAGGVVLSPNNQVLVVQQLNDTWSLPKGGIDPGEDELTAAKREIYEESGISDLTYVKDLGSFGRSPVGPDGKEMSEIYKTITLFLFTTD